MSQIINAIPPNALLPVAGALVGWCAHMLWFRAERAHVASGMARIRKFMRGNDEWLTTHQQRHAIEADRPHDAEVLHVAYPTQELRLVADDPQVAAGLAALADEVGLVQALSDEPEHTPACPDLFYCPTVDEVESGCHGGFDVCCVAPELHQPVAELRTMPALSDRPAEDDDEVGDEQPGEATSSVPPRIGGWWREQRARIRELFRFRSSAPVNPPYRGRHWVSDVQHTGTFPVINIPAQRNGGDE